MSKAESSKSADRAGQNTCADLRFSLQPDLEKVAPLVLDVECYLRANGLNEQDAFAIRLALAEACNNAIQYSSSSEPIEVEVQLTQEMATMTVLDHTAGFELPEVIQPPPDDAERGRGMFLMRTLMDSIEYHRDPSGNLLKLTKRYNRTHTPSLCSE